MSPADEAKSGPADGSVAESEGRRDALGKPVLPGRLVGHQFDEHLRCGGCGTTLREATDGAADGVEQVCPAWLALAREGGRSDEQIASSIEAATGRPIALPPR